MAADDSVVNAVSGGVLKVRVESEVMTLTVAADVSVVNAVSGGVLKVCVESEVTTLRLWPLVTLLSTL